MDSSIKDLLSGIGAGVEELRAEQRELKARLDDIDNPKARAAADFERGGLPPALRGPTGSETKAQGELEVKAFLESARTGNPALLTKVYANITTVADGGYAVPQELDRRIQEVAASYSPMRQIARAESGLRRGEILALQWSDIDFQRRSIHVQRSEWDGHTTTPKGGRSRRVDMTEQLTTALRAHRHLRGERVLCHEDGSPVGRKALHRWMLAARRRAGLGGKAGLHVLRHSFCSHLAMQGAPAKAIKELAGHSDLSTTMRYMHLSPSARPEAISLLDRRPGEGVRGETGEKSPRTAGNTVEI